MVFVVIIDLMLSEYGKCLMLKARLQDMLGNGAPDIAYQSREDQALQGERGDAECHGNF